MVLAGSLALIWQSGFVSGKVSATQSVAIPSAASAPQNQERKPPDIEGEAALVSANAATWQTVINAFGLVGLLFTVLYARAAWLEARASARADNRSLVLTRKALREQREGAIEQEKRMAEQIKLAEANLAEMRRATVEANRAWVVVSAKAVRPLIFGDKNISIMIGMRLENIGRSPASKILVDYGMFGNFSDAVRKIKVNTRDREAQDLYGDVLLPGEASEFPIELLLDRDAFINSIHEVSSQPEGAPKRAGICPMIMIGAQYLLPGDNKFRFTYKNYMIRNLRGNDPTFDGSPDTYQLSEFMLSDARDGGPVT